MGIIEVLAQGRVEATTQQDAFLSSDVSQDAAWGRPCNREWGCWVPDSSDGVKNVNIISLWHSRIASAYIKKDTLFDPIYYKRG